MSPPKVDIFPIPSLAPSKLSPTRLFGISPQSTSALRRILKDNHEKWHIFFNDKGFHNHAAHRAIAIWSLGADSTVLEAGYAADVSYQRPTFASPEAITHENFDDHLGDEKYYDAYLKFFNDQLEQHGTAATIEEFVLSKKANFNPKKDAENQPRMLDRFLGGLVHPLIHTGYGVEFGLPVMVIEGLAQAAVHGSSFSPLIPPSDFGMDDATEQHDMMASLFQSTLTLENHVPANVSSGTHALTIVARILKDPRFTGHEEMSKFTAEDGETLKKYVREWTLDTTDPQWAERKIEELVWANTIIYGVAGWNETKPFNADFFSMHLVTSSLFLSSLAAYMRPSSLAHFLRGYFEVCLAFWIGRGRPSFDIKGFFEADLADPVPFGPLPTPSKDAFPSPSSAKAVTPNPWFPIIQNSIVHPDEHLPKLQRSLQHYSSLYGTRAAGQEDFARTELPDADRLDGTLFIRIAGLTAERMGRVSSGEDKKQFWDRYGFFEETGSPVKL